MITRSLIAEMPKVELHCHLDGSLRVGTILDLAKKGNISLPAEDPEALKDWFIRGARQKSLKLYLEPFAVTDAVMQTAPNLYRVAYELVEDMAGENVCYAEIRFAPMLHLKGGLTPQEVVQAVLDGMEAASLKTGVVTRLILCAMRNESEEASYAVAELAVAFRDRGVVAFDLAGDENGHPAKEHLKAFSYARRQNFNITIHAGEGFGVESIWQAIQICGASRIGHGVRLTEDMVYEGTHITKMGSLSHFILDHRIPLEICLSSNVDTGASPSYEAHPFPLFWRNNFRCFLCTDNRLMSDTTLTKEMEIAADYYGLGFADMQKITLNAMKSAFIHNDKKLAIIYDVIKKQYADLREKYAVRD